jgi:1,4-dihydroxy-2-naphthoate octaprenyltransferase
MTAFILIGILCLVVGVMHLFAPEALVRLSAFLNRIISTDHKTMKYRVGTGLVFIALGLFFVFMAYYLANARGY